jgi:hypothetical protein
LVFNTAIADRTRKLLFLDINLLFQVGYIFPLDYGHNISRMTGLLNPIEALLKGNVAMLTVIEIVEISVLEDDEAAYGFTSNTWVFVVLLPLDRRRLIFKHSSAFFPPNPMRLGIIFNH